VDLIELAGVDSSESIRKALAAEGHPVLLAFSGGKDALAAWLALRDAGVEVVPYYLYLVPGLAFVDEAMAGWEQAFGRKIHRYPHPSLYRWLNNLMFQAPENCSVIEAAGFANLTHEQNLRDIRNDLGLPLETWVADGVRAADSPIRRASIRTHGPSKLRTHKTSVVWDWRKSHVLGRIEAAGLSLPVDYEWFGRSFDGIDHRFLEPMSRFAPDDYARVLEWFPLAALELIRHGL